MSEATPYQAIGGETGVRALVERFYEIMDTHEQAKTIRAMHANDLRVTRQKFFKFLSGWLGGPALYVEQYGHPRLRRRHLPFPIDTAAAHAWLLCMHQALEDTLNNEPLRAQLFGSFTQLAMHIRNQPDGDPESI